MEEEKVVFVDAMELGGVLDRIENSLDVSLTPEELESLVTIEDMIQLLVAKLLHLTQLDCTGQQAFYKLRKAIVDAGFSTREKVHPKTKLADLFPRPSRKMDVKRLEEHLKFRVDILEGKQLPISMIVITLLVSFVLFFVYPWVAMDLFAILLITLHILKYLGKDFKVETIEELVHKMVYNHYVDCRRHYGTYNLEEVQKLIHNILKEDLFVEGDEVDYKANVIW